MKSVSENALMHSSASLCPACMPCSQNASSIPCETLGAGPVGAEERTVGEVLVELRAVGDRAGAHPVEHVDRDAVRDWSRVFTISGGTAETSAAFATRFVP